MAAFSAFAETEHDGRFFRRTVTLIGRVYAKTWKIAASSEPEFANERRGFFTGNRQCVHHADRSGIVNNAAEFLRQLHPLPQPIDDECFKFSGGRRGAPSHRVDVER